MIHIFSKIAVLSLVMLCVLVFSQCTDNTLEPFEPEITSAIDNFQLQATDVESRTATLDYDWSNTGTRASINHSTTTSLGTAKLIIKDAKGIVVYEKLLVPSLNEPTAVGTSGMWTISLVLSAYSGTLNFRVQKI